MSCSAAVERKSPFATVTAQDDLNRTSPVQRQLEFADILGRRSSTTASLIAPQRAAPMPSVRDLPL
jgi:hypothetical protein